MGKTNAQQQKEWSKCYETSRIIGKKKLNELLHTKSDKI